MLVSSTSRRLRDRFRGGEWRSRAIATSSLIIPSSSGGMNRGVSNSVIYNPRARMVRAMDVISTTGEVYVRAASLASSKLSLPLSF